MIRPRAHVAGMAAYALADMTVAPGRPLISLAQNESPLPPSPAVLAAGQAALDGAALYPDPDWTDLRAATAEVHGVAPGRVLCGAGSMELIGALIRAYAGPGDEVLSTAHAYAFFRTAAEQAEAAYRAVPEVDHRVDVGALADAVTDRTRVVCVANPGNPTGTVVDADAIRALRAALPGDVLLLIDEAYGEFADTAPLWDLADRGDTVISRTLSKAYCLAGARVGWGVFPEAVAGEVRKLLNPNNVTGAAQAMATAAMRDQGYMREAVATIAARRDRFAEGLAGIGLPPVPSRTNFVLIPFADVDTARAADRALRAEGILMRGMGGYGLGHCLRATIGTGDDMAAALDVLTRWTKERPR